MGWCRHYWDYGASSVAIDPSGWKVLLVSLHFSKRDAASLSYYFFSLTTDMNLASRNPRVPAAQPNMVNTPGVRVHYYLLLAVC